MFAEECLSLKERFDETYLKTFNIGEQLCPFVFTFRFLSFQLLSFFFPRFLPFARQYLSFISLRDVFAKLPKILKLF